MKLICIDDRWEESQGNNEIISGPFMSEVVTVLNSREEDGTTWYELQEYQDANNYLAFEASAFAPISDLDEKDIQAKRQQDQLSHEKLQSLIHDMAFISTCN